jgi:hypothetical protein
MKNSVKIFAIIAVLAIYATLAYVVINFVDASNAGLHMNP